MVAGIRLLPTILNSFKRDSNPSLPMAYAVAALLRFLTPLGPQPGQGDLFVGRLDAGKGW